MKCGIGIGCDLHLHAPHGGRMKTRLAVAVGLLLLSVSAAQATPIRGTFTGVVTYSANPYWPFVEGTPAWGLFGYDTDYLSAPDEFGNRYVLQSPDPYAGFFVGVIANVAVGIASDSGSLLIGPNGLPLSGNGIGYFDISVGPKGFGFAASDFSTVVTVEGTYSLPDDEATLPVMVLGLAALAVARRFL
jgi:hypothetical protein